LNKYFIEKLGYFVGSRLTRSRKWGSNRSRKAVDHPGSSIRTFSLERTSFESRRQTWRRLRYTSIPHFQI